MTLLVIPSHCPHAAGGSTIRIVPQGRCTQLLVSERVVMMGCNSTPLTLTQQGNSTTKFDQTETSLVFSISYELPL